MKITQRKKPSHGRHVGTCHMEFLWMNINETQKDVIFLSDLWIFQIQFEMADQDDYESLPESAPFKAVATAGACAGIAEHCAMYPFDSVKVNWKKNILRIWQEHLYGAFVSKIRCLGNFKRCLYC